MAINRAVFLDFPNVITLDGSNTDSEMNHFMGGCMTLKTIYPPFYIVRLQLVVYWPRETLGQIPTEVFYIGGLSKHVYFY